MQFRWARCFLRLQDLSSSVTSVSSVVKRFRARTPNAGLYGIARTETTRERPGRQFVDYGPTCRLYCESQQVGVVEHGKMKISFAVIVVPLILLSLISGTASPALGDAGVFTGNGQNLHQITSKTVQLVSIDVAIILGRGPCSSESIRSERGCAGWLSRRFPICTTVRG